MTEEIPSESRCVYCEDAVQWLQERPVLAGCSLVASLPDVSEFPSFSLDEWKSWFTSTVRLVLSRTPDRGVAVFYQTDIRLNGLWIDKAFLCQKAAENEGSQLLWHKVVCRFRPGNSSTGRPAYTHLLCFSRALRSDFAKPRIDVLPESGDKTWVRGMGFEACRIIGEYITNETDTRTLVHPFCGQGSMLAVAEKLGLNAIGIERSPKRAELARGLTADLELRKFLRRRIMSSNQRQAK